MAPKGHTRRSVAPLREAEVCGRDVFPVRALVIDDGLPGSVRDEAGTDPRCLGITNPIGPAGWSAVDAVLFGDRSDRLAEGLISAGAADGGAAGIGNPKRGMPDWPL